MDMILGLGTVSATVLMFCWAYAAHRRPVPARWTRLPGLSMLTCVALTMLAPLGLGFFVKAALDPLEAIRTLNWEAAAVAAALAALAVILAPRVIAPARRRPEAADRGAAPASPVAAVPA